MLIIHGSAGIENSDSLASEETLRTAWFRSPVVYTREAEAHGQTAGRAAVRARTQASYQPSESLVNDKYSGQGNWRG